MLKPIDVDILRKAAEKESTNGARARRKLEVLKRCGFRCVECGSRYELTIDHVVKNRHYEKKNAAAYDPDLCRALCVTCHELKNQDARRHARWR